MKWLLLVGYDAMGASFWENNIAPFCNKQIGMNSYSAIPIIERDYTIIFFTAIGDVTEQIYKQLFEKLSIENHADVIIFSHKKRVGHFYGSTITEFHKLQKTFTKLKFGLFEGYNMDRINNYAFWLIFQLPNWLRKAESNSTFPSWDELQREADKISKTSEVDIPINERRSINDLQHFIDNIFISTDVDVQSLIKREGDGRGELR